MFVTPAYAQGIGAGTPDMLISILPFVLIFVIMYFLIIRPQRAQSRSAARCWRRSGAATRWSPAAGWSARSPRRRDNELEVDLGGGTKVTALRSTIMDVRVKGEPVAKENARNNRCRAEAI